MDPSAPGNWHNWLLFHNCKSIGTQEAICFMLLIIAGEPSIRRSWQGVQNKAERFVVSGQLKRGLKGTKGCIRGGTLMLIKD